MFVCCLSRRCHGRKLADSAGGSRLENQACRACSHNNVVTVSVPTYSHRSQGTDAGVAPPASRLHKKHSCSCLWHLGAIPAPSPPERGPWAPSFAPLTCHARLKGQSVLLLWRWARLGKWAPASSSSTAGVRLCLACGRDEAESIRAQMLSSQPMAESPLGNLWEEVHEMHWLPRQPLCDSEELSNRHRVGMGCPRAIRIAATHLLPLHLETLRSG